MKVMVITRPLILIFDTKNNIENGKFGFNNSDEKVCGYCDIKHLCHEKILKKSMEKSNDY